MCTASLPRELARAHLFCGAVFFALRGCEFVFVAKAEDRKTRPIRARDIVFRDGNRIVPHSDLDWNSPPDSVSIDFGDQKSDIKDETVTQDTTDDDELNPIFHYMFTIERLRSYPDYNDEWEISTFYDGSKFSKITSREMIVVIRAAVDFIGRDVLGFTSDEVGLHSNRASSAMWMYLAKEPVYSIMLLCRWSSDAFLAYIEKQVKEFTRGVSSRMLQHDTFFNVPTASASRQTKNNTNTTRGRSHHRRAHFNLVFGHRGSLRHQLRPRN